VAVEEEEKCVRNAEEAVDDVLKADTSNMLWVRYAVVGSSYTVGSSYCRWCWCCCAGECDDDRGDDGGGH